MHSVGQPMIKALQNLHIMKSTATMWTLSLHDLCVLIKQETMRIRQQSSRQAFGFLKKRREREREQKRTKGRRAMKKTKNFLVFRGKN